MTDPRQWRVKVRRVSDTQAAVSYDDSTGRVEAGLLIDRDEDTSSLPRYVRRELDDWWKSKADESETVEDGVPA